MGNDEFISTAKGLVRDYAGRHTKHVSDFDVYVVWNAYILGNIKALLSTTIEDGMYYEVTYNAVKNEIYFDAYRKCSNMKIVL